MSLVLIIDDSPQIRRLLRVMLESGGHLVREAEDGLVGWHMMQDERPCLVILDLMMLGLSGLDVLGALRADVALATVSVIVLTADGQAESKQQALANGASGFLEKPFSPAVLTRMIDALIRP